MPQPSHCPLSWLFPFLVTTLFPSLYHPLMSPPDIVLPLFQSVYPVYPNPALGHTGWLGESPSLGVPHRPSAKVAPQLRTTLLRFSFGGKEGEVRVLRVLSGFSGLPPPSSPPPGPILSFLHGWLCCCTSRGDFSLSVFISFFDKQFHPQHFFKRG